MLQTLSRTRNCHGPKKRERREVACGVYTFLASPLYPKNPSGAQKAARSVSNADEGRSEEKRERRRRTLIYKIGRTEGRLWCALVCTCGVQRTYAPNPHSGASAFPPPSSLTHSDPCVPSQTFFPCRYPPPPPPFPLPPSPHPPKLGGERKKKFVLNCIPFSFSFPAAARRSPSPNERLAALTSRPSFSEGEERGERVLARDSPTLPFEKSSSIVGLLSWLFFLDGCSFVQLS